MNSLIQLRVQRSAIGWTQDGLVITAVAVSVTSHGAAAVLGPAGAMAWWMAAMAAVCLACAAPMVGLQRCTSRAAEHLLGTGIVMILIHLAVLVLPGSGGHHGIADGAGTSHSAAMLALLGIELVCLVLASAALRLGERRPRPHIRTAAAPLSSPSY